MTMPCERFDLFPTRTWLFRLPQLAGLFPAWEREISDWRASEAAQGSSNRNGWTSAKTAFERVAFAPLQQAVQNCMTIALAEAGLPRTPALQIHAWVNWQEPGGFNHFHSHGAAALSAVFYLTVPPGSGEIVFRDPRPGINLIGLTGDGANCKSVASHAPAAGELLIIPGWLEHAVDLNAASTARISIAANCYLDPAAGRD